MIYGNKIVSLTADGNDQYSTTLDDFENNGVAYLVLREVYNAAGVGESEKLEALYIDNLDPSTETANTGRYTSENNWEDRKYINKSLYGVYHSSSEEGRGIDYSEEDLITGYTGTRAYIDIFFI